MYSSVSLHWKASCCFARILHWNSPCCLYSWILHWNSPCCLYRCILHWDFRAVSIHRICTETVRAVSIGGYCIETARAVSTVGYRTETVRTVSTGGYSTETVRVVSTVGYCAGPFVLSLYTESTMKKQSCRLYTFGCLQWTISCCPTDTGTWQLGIVHRTILCFQNGHIHATIGYDTDFFPCWLNWNNQIILLAYILHWAKSCCETD